ncbi:MAG: uroporphyrinogen decarboxylase [Alphaproteobacteria bacterium]|nr:uroporphyrinogen decarboxylase [Alphaproteobacteria bacterium]
MTKPLLQALARQVAATPPIWLMRQAGRYLPEYRQVRQRAGSFLDLCLNPELAAEVTLQPLHRYGLDAAILFSDILIIPYALGQRVSFVEGEGPKLEPIREAAELGRLDATGVAVAVAPVLETVRRVRRELPATAALIGFAGAPWTVSTYMVEGGSSRDFSLVKNWAYRSPSEFSRLVDVIVDATVEYLDGQIAAGAEVIQLFDTWAGVLSERMFQRWVTRPTMTIVRRLKAAHPQIPIIGFPRGAGANLEPYISQTEVDAVGLDTTVPLSAARALQRRLPVQGNLDPLALVVGGDAMAAEIDAILDVLAEGPFVFNLGHGIVPQTPPEHVDQLVRLVRNRR